MWAYFVQCTLSFMDQKNRFLFENHQPSRQKCKRFYRQNIFLWPRVKCQNVSVWFFLRRGQKDTAERRSKCTCTQRQGLDNSLIAWKAVVRHTALSQLCNTGRLCPTATDGRERAGGHLWDTARETTPRDRWALFLLPLLPEVFGFSYCTLGPALWRDQGVEEMDAPAPQDPPIAPAGVRS